VYDNGVTLNPWDLKENYNLKENFIGLDLKNQFMKDLRYSSMVTMRIIRFLDVTRYSLIEIYVLFWVTLVNFYRTT
jgi:hypothetical protein